MSFRTTILIVLIGVVVGVVVLVVKPFQSTPEGVPAPPWFYNVSMEDISRVEVEYRGEEMSFVQNEEGIWVFNDPPDVPVDRARWGGLTLLLSGPQARRLLVESTNVPEQYGLDIPETIIKVSLTGERSIQVRLGDQTVNGSEHYSQVGGFPQVFLIDSSWGNVLSRLVTEPPFPAWYLRLTPESIVGLQLLQGDKEVNYKFSDDIGWYVDDENKTPVDEERWAALLPLLGKPSIHVAEYIVDDPATYGISEDSITAIIKYIIGMEGTIEIRKTVEITLGSRSPDGSDFYAQGQQFDGIILIEAEWGETIRRLLENPPYASLAPSASSG